MLHLFRILKFAILWELYRLIRVLISLFRAKVIKGGQIEIGVAVRVSFICGIPVSFKIIENFFRKNLFEEINEFSVTKLLVLSRFYVSPKYKKTLNETDSRLSGGGYP